MMRLLAALTLTVAATAPPVAGSPGQQTVEPMSRTPFPLSLTPPGGTVPHQLIGTGLRDRTIFRVKIYAFGLYVDPEGARSALSPFAGIPASTLRRDERFYRRLLELDFAMTLRLVMLRSVDGANIAKAFNDALRRRMAREPAVLDRFRANFDVAEVADGTEIVFSCSPVGRLTSSVGGRVRPPIDSRPLCRALFDVYLGETPISDPGKRNVIAGFPALLAPR